ncbi:MAG: M23 family metallopeptidase [Bacteroidia bacterium]|nr:M23 family metallopeptidase [Bacteroidia bacterium]
MNKLIVFSILTISCSNPGIIQSNITNKSLNSYEPYLRMPFSSGVVVLCVQGNLSPEGFSHSLNKINCCYSLDFLNNTFKNLEIVASADGEIADIFTTALPNKDFPEGGWGWGNYVIIEHKNHFFTLYAHMDKIFINVGQKVSSGTILGVVGKTGLAGGIEHLHFGLFKGEFRKHFGTNPPLLPEHVPIKKILTIDLDRNAKGFKYYRGSDIVGIPILFGNIYGSENSIHHQPQPGDLPKSVLDSLYVSRQRLLSYLKTDPFDILKIKGNINVQKQTDIIKEKLKSLP